MGVCQKNCGIDYGKCLVTTFDINTCTKQEAACALDCLKGVKAKPFKIQVKNDVGSCEKNCGIDFGKCLITTGDFKSCLKDQASCALDCLKSVKAKPFKIQVKNRYEECLDECNIDFGKCLRASPNVDVFLPCSKEKLSCKRDCNPTRMNVAQTKDVGVC